jgi:hypothetical protein
MGRWSTIARRAVFAALARPAHEKAGTRIGSAESQPGMDYKALRLRLQAGVV